MKVDQIAELGTPNDPRRQNKPRKNTKPHTQDVTRTRDWIFNDGQKITGARVERVLGEQSWVPTHVSHPGSHTFGCHCLHEVAERIQFQAWEVRV